MGDTQPKLIIIGGGGFGREILWLAQECYEGKILGFLDDSDDMQGRTIHGKPVLGTIDHCTDYQDAAFVIAVGPPRIRKKIADKLQSLITPTYATLIHPSVLMGPNVSIGAGSMVCAGCILTTDISIKAHAIINLNVTIGHDCQFNQYCTIAPMAAISGNTIMEECVEVGTSASIRQGTTLKKGSMLGMGSVLTKPLDQNVMAFGNPAKKIKVLTD